GFRVLCPSWRDGQQPPGRPRDQHACPAPNSELHGLHQHVDDSETTGAAALATKADTPRLRCAEPADLGARESVWPIRSRHEYAIGIAVIEPGMSIFLLDHQLIKCEKSPDRREFGDWGGAEVDEKQRRSPSAKVA